MVQCSLCDSLGEGGKFIIPISTDIGFVGKTLSDVVVELVDVVANPANGFWSVLVLRGGNGLKS